MDIRALVPDDADAYARIRREALEREPFAFAASPEDDRALDPAFVRQALSDPDQAVFGAFDPDLVGVAGLFRDRHVKAAHKAHLWGLYVSPRSRGAGVGRSLVRAALRFARGLDGVSHVHLCVAESVEPARALYREMGFVTWGTEPDALRVGDRILADHHMVLELE